MRVGLTCVIPAHNEGEGIFDTILEIDSSVSGNNEFIIFVSEDGSKDNTRSEVARAAKTVKNSRVILAEPANRLGYSRAVQRGILECETQLICFMDADGQCNPKEISTLLEAIKNTDNAVVVGYRNPRVDGVNRLIYSKLFGLVYRILGGPKRIDPSSPFVLAKIDDVSILGNVECHLAFGFWWEFQWRIENLGLSTIEIPVEHRSRVVGKTQVYSLKRLPQIVKSHLIGLLALRKELKN